jgi:hypothetical protein
MATNVTPTKARFSSVFIVDGEIFLVHIYSQIRNEQIRE